MNRFTREFDFRLFINNLKANSLVDLFILKYLLFSLIGSTGKIIYIYVCVCVCVDLSLYIYTVQLEGNSSLFKLSL